MIDVLVGIFVFDSMTFFDKTMQRFAGNVALGQNMYQMRQYISPVQPLLLYHMASAIPGEGWMHGDAKGMRLRNGCSPCEKFRGYGGNLKKSGICEKFRGCKGVFGNLKPTKMTQTWSEGTLPQADRRKQTKKAAEIQNMEVKTLW